MPVASATASPPLEPPGVRCGFQGLKVGPCKGLSVDRRRPNSGRLVRASTMAPAALRRATTGASRQGMALRNTGTPWVVADPTQSRFSLTVNGTPCKGPRAGAVCRASLRPTASLPWPR